MTEYKGFIGGSNTSQSPISDPELTVNWYVENSESDASTNRISLYPTPGVELIAEGRSGNGRCNFAIGGRQFVVIGSDFIEVFSDGSTTTWAVAGLTDDGLPATISSNGDGGGQLFITSGMNGYLFDLTTNTFSTIAALNGIARMGDQLDGYFLCLDDTTSTVRISDLLDGSTWDPTQFFQRNIAPDPWVAMKVANRYIYLLGTETTEVWFDAGSFPIPFEPHPSGLMQFGCAAQFSPEVVTGALCWLSQTSNGAGQVMRATGFTPEPISTYSVEYEFGNYSQISDAIGDTYHDLGHTFYYLTFPTANKTKAWDSATQVWCDRGSWPDGSVEFSAWRPLYHSYCFGEHRILDFQGPGIYRMSSTLGMDVDDTVIRRLRRGPLIEKENKRFFYSSFEIDMETGLGNAVDPGADPQISMRMTNDGKTWGTEQFRSVGRIGEYDIRVRWTRCGMARQRSFEVSVSDPIPYRLLGAYIKTQPSLEANAP